jgi:spore coat protein A
MYATYGKAGFPDGEEQRGATLWYHDHGMGVTRLNVYAGLFGFWIIRDPTEGDLVKAGVLPGEDDELFLVIQDRNFDAADDGSLDGRILHKTETSTAEMFGPCTLVNGKLWPTTKVPARPLRVRILNGSNSRTYCLRLVEVGTDSLKPGQPEYGNDFTDPPAQAPWWQIGTDGGLLDYPVRPVSLAPDQTPNATGLVNRGLVLAPAERADLVIDFGQLVTMLSDQGPTGRKVALVNTAVAPFHGSTITYPFRFNQNGIIGSEDGTTPPAGAGTTNDSFRVPFAHALQFAIGPDEAKPVPSPLGQYTYGPNGEAVAPQPGGQPPLDPKSRRYVHKAGAGNGRAECVLPADHVHRWIALDEDPTGNLTFRELEAYTTDPDVAAAAPRGLALIPIAALNGVVTWYRTLAKGFHEQARFFVKSGGCEVWKILNLTGDTHPVHVHLVQFQVLSRQRYNASSYQTPPQGLSMTATLTPSSTPQGPSTVTVTVNAPIVPVTPVDVPQPPDPNEQGFKDTVRVNPGEVVTIAAFFKGYCGKYMYHCHILEHEDHDMMRPFVVVAMDAFALMEEDMIMNGPMPM